MKIKSRPTKRKKAKFILGIEQELGKPMGRLPQLNKALFRRG